MQPHQGQISIGSFSMRAQASAQEAFLKVWRIQVKIHRPKLSWRKLLASLDKVFGTY